MKNVTVYRGIGCNKEEQSLKMGILSGKWYSTDLSDAINFAMKTKGLIIKCEVILKEERKDCYLTALDEKVNHKGWGLKERKGDFSFGDWYYIHPNYSNHVRLQEAYSFQQALELEAVLDNLAEKVFQ